MDLKSLRDILGGGVQGVGTKLALKRQAWAGASVGGCRWSTATAASSREDMETH